MILSNNDNSINSIAEVKYMQVSVQLALVLDLILFRWAPCFLTCGVSLSTSCSNRLFSQFWKMVTLDRVGRCTLTAIAVWSVIGIYWRISFSRVIFLFQTHEKIWMEQTFRWYQWERNSFKGFDLMLRKKMAKTREKLALFFSSCHLM